MAVEVLNGSIGWLMVAAYDHTYAMTLSALLIFHITAGTLGLAAGAVALLVRKGAWLHRAAGNAFFAAMILMSIAGGALAVAKDVAAAFNAIVATLTIYMVATSWMTVTRAEKETGSFEILALLAVLVIAAGGMFAGVAAANSPNGVGGIPAFLFYGFSFVAVLAAVTDVSVIMRGGLSGAQRIARHLWRMCSALLLGTLAFFVGQGAKVFPAWVREAGLLPGPVLLVLVITLFWLVRVLMTDWYARQAAHRQPVRPDARP